MHCVDLCFLFFYKGTNKIEILHLDSPIIQDKVINWNGKAFKKMKNLRILIIRKCHFSQAPKYLPESLKVLEWWRYPSEELPSDFDLKKLVICKLPNMEFKSPELTEFLQASINFLSWSFILKIILLIMFYFLNHMYESFKF